MSVKESTDVVKICEYCGSEYKVYKCLEDVQRFCSRECYEASRARHSKICPICKTEFVPNRKGQVYCGRKCAHESLKDRVECTCENCGKTFIRKRSDIDRAERHYCSEKCKKEEVIWKQEDIDILLNKYGTMSYSEIQKLLSEYHPVKSISEKACMLGITVSKHWSKEDTDILINNYEVLPFDEVQKMLPQKTPSSILGKARQYGLKSYFYRIRVYTDDEYDYIKNNYLYMSDAEMAEYLGRSQSAISQRRNILDLHRPDERQGSGYKNLSAYVRRHLQPWKDSVLAEFHNTCAITGAKENLVVHHIRSFNLLFNETVSVLKFPEYDNFEAYTDEQLSDFLQIFLRIQEYYHSYICISNSIHILFHKEYGYGDNTQEQWSEFIIKYQNHYYDSIV